MNFKALTLGLAVASVATFSMAKPVDYKIDPTHTATVFTWNHFGFSTPSANFSDIQGTISVDNAKPADSSVNVTIPLSSLNTNVAALDEHLKNADFFDAAKYPNITFKSTKVQALGKNKQGEHPMTKAQSIGFNATTSFNRSAFGVGAYVPNVGDKITVNITTEASVAK